MARIAFALLLTPLGLLAAQATPPLQTEADAYTRYELLSPGSGKFRIIYDVTVTAAGARYYFNPIRKGSVASNESVIDPATGRLLQFEAVDGATARTQGLPGADLETRYIRVELPRPVPAGGEIRILIDKTYEDAKSYFEESGELVFTRSLGIKRNAVVLPPGYELVRCNVPSQVLTESDGRTLISFINASPDAASLTLRARRTSTGGAPAALAGRLPSGQTDPGDRLLLQQPGPMPRPYHDYTNSARGRTLPECGAGREYRSQPIGNDSRYRRKVDARFLGRRDHPCRPRHRPSGQPETEVVVIPFPAVQKGQSTRLRISETYTDPVRYRVEGDQLIWDRGFGRPFNAVVLPVGWLLTHSAVPATISTMPDGRVRLDFVIRLERFRS
jgi:hypothetical protein